MRHERTTSAANRETVSASDELLASTVEAVALLDESALADNHTTGTASVRTAELRPTSSAAPNRGREVDELHQQLGAKDELISALVGELEQVVEQLDRMQRQGHSQGQHRPQVATNVASPMPTEVVEEQQQVLADLQRVVQQWEALQASSVLGRIENEIGELRSLMIRSVRLPIGEDVTAQEVAGQDGQLDKVLSRLTLDRPAPSGADGPSGGTSWEAIKRRMMHGDAEPDQAAPAGITGFAEVKAEQPEEAIPALHTVVVPQPINLDTATEAQLRQACDERDAYVVQLTRMLRSRHAVSLPDSWDDLQEIPVEQKARVEHLANRLEEQVRLAEVEISLDRARLSRERLQLQADQDLIEKHLKRLGLSSLDELESVAVDGSSNSDRRWMRFLGVNRRG